MPCVAVCASKDHRGYDKGNVVRAYPARIVGGKIEMQIGAHKDGTLNWVNSIGPGEKRKKIKDPKTGRMKKHPKGINCAEQAFAQFYLPDTTAEELLAEGKIGPGRSKINFTSHLSKSERDDIADPKKNTKPHKKASIKKSAVVMEANPTPFPDPMDEG